MDISKAAMSCCASPARREAICLLEWGSLFFSTPPLKVWELRARLPLMYTLCPATVQEIRKMAHNTGGDYVVQIIPNQYITGSVLDGYINARKSEFGEAWTREVGSYSGVISGEN